MPSGLSFPPKLTSLGKWEVKSGLDKYRQNIQSIASTMLKERWYEPAFGTTAYKAVFRNPSLESAQFARDAVARAIRELEPRVSASISVSISDNNPGTIIVNVRYRVLPTDEQDEFEFEVGDI